MSEYTGDVIVKMLEQAGVKHIWGITGESANYITEAVNKSKIRFMAVRHEETAAFAAGAEARSSGKLSACIGACGPGSLHLLNGLYDANLNRSPVICLATHILKNEIGFEYVQETDPKKIFASCSVFCEYVQSPHQLPRLLSSAMQHAVSKKGVAVLIVPGDVSARIYDGAGYKNYKIFYPLPRVFPVQEDLFKIAECINTSNQLVIIAGEGCEGAHDLVILLSHLRKAAVAWTYSGKQYIEYDNPYAIGVVGEQGIDSVAEAMKSCDLLLQLGSDCLPDGYEINGRIVQIGADARNLGIDRYVDFAFEGNVKETLLRVLPLINEQGSTCYVQELLMLFEEKCREYDLLYRKKVTSGNEIYPEYLYHLIDKRSSDEAVFCADTGKPLALMQRHIHASEFRFFYQSIHWGVISNAVPTALGVKASFPHKQVIAFCVNGGLLAILGDLITAVQMHLPIKIILLNNEKSDFDNCSFLFSEHNPAAVMFKNNDYAAIASSIGFASYRVKHVSELESAIDRWLDQDKPAFLDVKVAALKNI